MPGYQTVKTEIMTAFQKGFTKSAKRFIDDHSSIYSHAESKHLNISDAELIDNLLQVRAHEGMSKRADSRFTDKETYYRALQKVLKEQADRIQSFLETTGVGQEYPIEHDCGQIIGHGFLMRRPVKDESLDSAKHMIHAVNCTAVFMIIRNEGYDKRLGRNTWSIKTACPLTHSMRPDMQTTVQKGSARTILPAIQASQTYLSACPEKKAALTCLCAETYPSCLVHTRYEDNPVRYVTFNSIYTPQAIVLEPDRCHNMRTDHRMRFSIDTHEVPKEVDLDTLAKAESDIPVLVKMLQDDFLMYIPKDNLYIGPPGPGEDGRSLSDIATVAKHALPEDFHY